MDVHMAFEVHFYYTFYFFLCKSSLMIFFLGCALCLFAQALSFLLVSTLADFSRRRYRTTQARVEKALWW
jgi:hypothetical protein